MPRRFYENFWYTELREKSTAAHCQSYGGNPEHRAAQKALQALSTLCEPKTFSSCKLLAGFRLTQTPCCLNGEQMKKPIPSTSFSETSNATHPGSSARERQLSSANCSGTKISLDNWCTHRDHNLDSVKHHSVKLTWKSGTTSDIPWGSSGSWRRIHR